MRSVVPSLRSLTRTCLLVALLTLLVPAAHAAACTVTWTGGSSGSWSTASDWSTNTVPASGDDVCIPSGSEVGASSVSVALSSITAPGASLSLNGSSVSIADASDIGELTVGGSSSLNILDLSVDRLDMRTATIDGGILFVEDEGSWSSGTVGSTLRIGAMATVEVEQPTYTAYSGPKLTGSIDNYGTVHVTNQALRIEPNATVVNRNVLRFGDSGQLTRQNFSSGQELVNLGTLSTDANAVGLVYVPIQNDGTVEAGVDGALGFSGGSLGATSGIWRTLSGGSISLGAGGWQFDTLHLAGNLQADGLTVEDITATAGSRLTVGRENVNGNLTVTGQATVPELYLHFGYLYNGGHITVTDSLTMDGTRFLPVVDGEQGQLTSNGTSSVKLFNAADDQLITNNGEMSISGTASAKSGVKLVNNGTLTLVEALLLRSGTYEEPELVNAASGVLKADGYGAIGWVYSGPGLIRGGSNIGIARGERGFGDPMRQLGPDGTLTGDPVNAVTGNFTDSHQDLIVPGRGLSLQLVRTFNALDPTEGAFGRGWTHSYESSVEPLANGQVIVRDPFGSQHRFRPKSGGGYTSPVGDRDTLVKYQVGGVDRYRVETPDDTVWRYGVNGLIAEIEDRNDNALSFDYDSGDRLEAVTDPTGREILFDYDSAGRVSAVTDPAGETVEYDYTGGRLTSVTDRTGAVSEYAYDTEGRMTEKTAPSKPGDAGGTTTIVYDSNGRTQSVSESDDVMKTSYVYDLGQQKTTIHDSKGNQSVYRYNDYGQVKQTVDPNGGIINHVFDEDGRMVEQENELGHKSLYQYDSIGRVTETSLPNVPDPENNDDPTRPTTVMAYGAFDQVTSSSDSSGTATLTYDANGNLVGAEDQLGNETEYTVDAHGQVTGVEDARGNDSSTTYNPDGTVATVTDRRGKTVVFDDYDDVGRVLQTHDELGRQTDYEYDEEGRLTKRTLPAESSSATRLYETYAYDARGNLVDKRDTAGEYWLYEYDAHDRLVSQTDPTGRETEFEYDTEGNRTKTIQPSGVTTETEYDKLRRPIRIRQLNGTNNPPTTHMSYDLAGRVTRTTDAEGRETDYEYDALNRLVKVTDADDGEATYRYDTVGNLLSTTDPDGQTIEYEYDDLGRRTDKHDAAGNHRSWTYDPNGNLHTRTDGRGITTTYSYDAEDQQTGIDYPTGSGSTDVTNVYDDAGQLSSVTDAAGTTTYEYDGLGRMLRENLPHDRQLTRGFDAAGNQTSIGLTTDATGSSPTTHSIQYGFDDAGRMTSLTDATQGTWNFTYDTGGRLTGMEHPSTGVTASYSYDALGRPSGLEQAKGSTDFSDVTYGYDRVGNLLSIDDAVSVPGKQTDADFQYDALDRITNETHVVPGTGSVTPKTSSSAYTYTPGGDRLTKTDEDGNVASYDYDDGHELAEIMTVDASSIAGKSTAFTYDANGNQTQKTVTPPSSASPNTPTVTNRVFDAEDNMVGYADRTFVYDSADHKVEEADATNGVTAQNVYDGDSPFARYAITSGAPNGPPVVTIDGPTGMLGDTSTDAKDTLADALGSPLGQYDSAGVLTGTRSYDAFGGQLATPNAVSAPSVQQGWMGNRDVDPTQGVSDFNARAFSVEDGRFMGVDPVEGSLTNVQDLNPYIHGTNNPYRYPDAAGTKLIPSWSDVKALSTSTVGSLATGLLLCGDFASHYLLDSGSHDNTDWGAVDQASAIAGCVPGVGKLASVGLKSARKSYSFLRAGKAANAERLVDESVGLGHVNPGWNDRLPGTQENCVSCALATDLTYAGKFSSAIRYNRPRSIIQLQRATGSKFGPKTTRTEIEDKLSEAGPGTRGIVYGERHDGTAHVFNGVVDQRGTVKFRDGQRNRAANWDDNYKYFMLMRTN